MAGDDTDQDRKLARGAPIGDRKVLESLPSRARTTNEAAAARSRLVRRLRIALPVTAVALIGIFALNTGNRDTADVFLDEFENLTAATEELRMANPRFTGVDNDGQPFEITANAAIQNPQDQTHVALESPKAVQGANDNLSVVTADKGLYASETNILELRDAVTFERQIGPEVYVLSTPEATVRIKEEIVSSDVGVGGDGPDGAALKADRMTAYNSEGRIVFEGNVSMRIIPKDRKNKDQNQQESEDE